MFQNIPDFFGCISSSSAGLLVVTTTLLLIYLTVLRRNSKVDSDLPPGPMGLPFFGNVLQMVKDPHLKLSRWAAQYGKMYTINILDNKALVISDVELVKELFSTFASTGKFAIDSILRITQGPYGIVSTEGNAWAEQRQFCMRNLRVLGFGKRGAMEPLILDDAHALCDWIRREIRRNDAGGTIDLHHVLNQTAVNALWSLVTGERISLDDHKSAHMWSEMAVWAQYTMQTGLGFFPWLKHVAPTLSGYVGLDTACKTIHRYIELKFEEHKRTQVAGETRDLIDMYLEHYNKMNESTANAQSSFYGKTGWQNCVSSVVELFAAGGETTSTTMKWAAVYLSHNVGAQNRFQAEIDEVVGRDKDPSLDDRPTMPYAEAVIAETLRHSSIIMFGAPHKLLEDVSFHGYQLPKGLTLIANLYHAHHDPAIWGDPMEFRPERFLTSDGQKLLDHLAPFLVGKRQCSGEPLARDALFLFLVKLFQQFNFRPVTGVSEKDYLSPDVGLLLLTRCSKFAITSR